MRLLSEEYLFVRSAVKANFDLKYIFKTYWKVRAGIVIVNVVVVKSSLAQFLT